MKEIREDFNKVLKKIGISEDKKEYFSMIKK